MLDPSLALAQPLLKEAVDHNTRRGIVFSLVSVLTSLGLAVLHSEVLCRQRGEERHPVVQTPAMVMVSKQEGMTAEEIKVDIARIKTEIAEATANEDFEKCASLKSRRNELEEELRKRESQSKDTDLVKTVKDLSNLSAEEIKADIARIKAETAEATANEDYEKCALLKTKRNTLEAELRKKEAQSEDINLLKADIARIKTVIAEAVANEDFEKCKLLAKNKTKLEEKLREKVHQSDMNSLSLKAEIARVKKEVVEATLGEDFERCALLKERKNKLEEELRKTESRSENTNAMRRTEVWSNASRALDIASKGAERSANHEKKSDVKGAQPSADQESEQKKTYDKIMDSLTTNMDPARRSEMTKSLFGKGSMFRDGVTEMKNLDGDDWNAANRKVRKTNRTRTYYGMLQSTKQFGPTSPVDEKKLWETITAPRTSFAAEPEKKMSADEGLAALMKMSEKLMKGKKMLNPFADNFTLIPETKKDVDPFYIYR